MYQDIKKLYGKRLAATDGDIGHVMDFYFDDNAWTIRYVVVDTGSWLTGRLILLAPHAFAKLDQSEEALHVKLRKQQIQDSPSIASHETVSQQFEEQYYRSYGWPVYWQGGQMWGMSGDPLVLSPQPQDIATRQALEPRADRHLQSAKAIDGYHVQAVDGDVGRLISIHVNAVSWAIQEFVVETGHWYSSRQMLISPSKISRISYLEKKVFAGITKEGIKHGAARPT